MKEEEDAERRKDLLASKVALVDLVRCQEGAIVSRTIINKKTGTVTLFAFDEGQTLTEHTSPFDALVLVLDGAAEITISSAAHHVAPGEMILMPANQPHALRALKQFKMLLIMIRA